MQKTEKFLCAPERGSVAHSQPEREYQECINKAKAVVNAIELAQRRDEM